jgi:uncharacterized membrane protein HdeD (DUF308 family)
MTGDRARLPFVVLHLTLGFVVLFGSVRTVVDGLRAGAAGGAHWHLVLLGTLEAVGAVLFLLPRSTRLGGGLMLATFAIVIVAHAVQREFPGNLLVYAAATWLVMARGSLFHRTPASPSGVS